MKICLYEPCGKYLPYEQEISGFPFCDNHCALMAVEMYYEIDKAVDPNFKCNANLEEIFAAYNKKHGR